MSIELLWLLGQGAGVVLVAALMNRYAPLHRGRLRRVVVLYLLYAGVFGADALVRTFGPSWAPGFDIAVELFRAFVLVNLGGALVFLVLLPLLGLRLPMIAGDLLVGVAYLVGLFSVLSGHGLDPSSVLATGAVVSAVLAISLQTTLGNILGGVALQLDGSVREGDFVQLPDGKQGTVKSVRWRHTLVETDMRATIVVPNSLLLAQNFAVLGWGDRRTDPAAVSVDFHVDVTVSPTRVLEMVGKALRSSPIADVAATPAPTCICAQFDRDGIATYTVRYHLIDPRAAKEAGSRVLVRVHATLRRAGIALSARSNVKQEPFGTERYIDALKKVSLFDSLDEEELAELASTMTYSPYTAGETIANQGATATVMFILAAGTVEVRTKFDVDGAGPLPERSGLVATLTALDFFGEMGLVTGEPRKADVVAKTDVECFRIKKEDLERILQKRPDIARELSEELAQRAVALRAVRDDLDDAAVVHVKERDRIHSSIRKFFGLAS